MIKVLIVEDSSSKAKKIIEVLKSIDGCSYEIASDIVTARKALQQNFQLLILDLHLPERFPETAVDSKGLEFVLEMKKSTRLKMPEHIIGLTEHIEIHDKYKSSFDENLISLVKYDPGMIDWENKVKAKIDGLKMATLNGKELGADQFDVAFITALIAPELEAVLKLDYGWEKFKMPYDSANYYKGQLELGNGQVIRLVASHQPQMGMTATATSSMKLINHFHPKYLIMTGICGGIESKVSLGDVVIADMSFDLESGKIVMDVSGKQEFEPDFRVIPLNSSLKENLMELTTDHYTLGQIKSKWEMPPTDKIMRLHIGPMGTGAAVIANKEYIDTKIRHQRKLIAIDMETYAVFFSSEYSVKPHPIPISIKAVSDYANPDKGDDMQVYCSMMSAAVADHIIRNILQFD